MSKPTKFAIKTAERKATIIKAAARIIVEEGIGKLTHRKVAATAGVPLGSTTQHFESLDELKGDALQYLSAETGEHLRRIAQALDSSNDIAADIANMLFDYMSDIANLQVEAAFYVSSIEHPELRPLTTHWLESSVELLGNYMSRESAQAIAMLVDGMMLYVIAHESLPDKAFLQSAIQKLMEQ